MRSGWNELTEDSAAALPGQLGVYELADTDGTIVAIEYAGGHEPFGLRSALLAEVERRSDAGATGGELHFRVEYTHAYLTRSQELLMRYEAEHGELPVSNRGQRHQLGRLTLPGTPTVQEGA